MKENIFNFPCILKSIDTGILVLAVSGNENHFEGTCLSENVREDVELGSYSRMWNTRSFDAFQGDITLRSELKSNKEDEISECSMRYVIVRTSSAGVFAGYLKHRSGKEVILLNARRLWQWSGAASLSQLAMDGVSNPNNCKFPIEMDKVELTEAIEIIDVTEKAKKSIQSVEIWKK